MAASKLGARTLAVLALAPLALAAGCYSTTPHRAQVASSATAHECSAVIADVFARSGFVQLPTPPQPISMLFGARTSGTYSPFLSTNSGVGVTVLNNDAGVCRVTLEVMSPDVNCPGTEAGPSGTLNCQREGTPAIAVYPEVHGMLPGCPTVPRNQCTLSYAPGAQNDAAVDELARRLQVALGQINNN